MRRLHIHLLILIALSVHGTAIAQRLSPSHIELAKSVVAKYEDTPAWLEYFEFRFSQQFPEAPESFYISVGQQISQLGKVYDDSLSYLYASKMSEKELLACLQFIESTIGTRYRQFLTVGIREHFDASLTEKMAPKMVKKYRNAFLGDSAATGYKSGLLNQNELWRFSSYFSDSPIADELESGMIAKFDTVPPRTWASASAELDDSIVAQIARIAPEYLSEHEIEVLDSMFATLSGRPLDPRVHRDWFGEIESRNYAKFQRTYLKRWRRFEYTTFRYPKIGQEIDFRGIKFKIILKGELLETEELNSDYDGVEWLVEISGFTGKAHDYTVLSRWLADYRFLSGGKHKIYFVKKKYPLNPEDMKIYSFTEYVEYIKTQEPKLKKKFVAMELITTGKEGEEREMNKSPLY